MTSLLLLLALVAPVDLYVTDHVDGGTIRVVSQYFTVTDIDSVYRVYEDGAYIVVQRGSGNRLTFTKSNVIKIEEVQ